MHRSTKGLPKDGERGRGREKGNVYHTIAYQFCRAEEITWGLVISIAPRFNGQNKEYDTNR